MHIHILYIYYITTIHDILISNLTYYTYITYPILTNLYLQTYILITNQLTYTQSKTTLPLMYIYRIPIIYITTIPIHILIITCY